MPQQFARVHGWVKEYYAWGTVVGILGVGVALHQLRVDSYVREATLFALASERLAAARELDAREHREEPWNDVGHSRVLEEMTTLSISLESIDAHLTYLGDAQLAGSQLTEANLEDAILTGTDLSEADLRSARLRGARLSFANLAGAKLASGDLTDAVLHCADVIGATLNGTILQSADLLWADLSASDLTGVIGLKQDQLDDACGEPGLLPAGYTLRPCVEGERRRRCR